MRNIIDRKIDYIDFKYESSYVQKLKENSKLFDMINTYTDRPKFMGKIYKEVTIPEYRVRIILSNYFTKTYYSRL